jgi:GntR family transcriptional regulator
MSGSQVADWYVPIMRTPTIAMQIAGDLNRAIDRGIYAPGTRLPGERQLAEEIHVSRSTLRTALEKLEQNGRIVRSAQRGWFVPSPTVGEPPSTLLSFTEMARQRGLTATSRILDRSVRSATLSEAGRLRISPGAEVLHLERLRGMDGTPICVDRNVIPMEIGTPLLHMDLTDTSLYEALERHCDVSIHRSAYSVQATSATADIAALLGIPAASPVLVGEEVAYELDGRPVLTGYNTYRGDAYRFEADLFRSA